MNSADKYICKNGGFSGADGVTIDVNGQKVDVTSCANSKCTAPKAVSPFASKDKRMAYMEDTKKYLECVNINCKPSNTLVQTSLTQQMGNIASENVPVEGKPKTRPPLSIVDEELGNEAENDIQNNIKTQEVKDKDSFLKQQNTKYALIGIGVVLIGIGIYLWKKK